VSFWPERDFEDRDLGLSSCNVPGGGVNFKYLKKKVSSVPIYYSNADRSSYDNQKMQTHFGSLGPLVRVPALDGCRLNSSHSDLGVSDYDTAQVVSYLRVIEHAYNSKEPYVLILSDEATSDLVPFWKVSVDELAVLATTQEPSWQFLRLQYFAYTPEMYTEWTQNTTRMLFNTSETSGSGVANLFSRKGLEAAMERFKDGSGLSCKNIPADTTCSLDSLLSGAVFPHSFAVAPPMFTVRIEDARLTGVKYDSADCRPISQSNESLSMSYLQSLQWNVEDSTVTRHGGTTWVRNYKWTLRPRS